MSEGETVFHLSAMEMPRRREVYTRLVAFIALGALLSSVDLLARRSLTAALALSALFVFLFGSWVWFARSFARYAHTVWILTDLNLVRACEARRDEHEISDIERVRVKRTVSGNIRAVTVSICRRGILYVNGLEEPERFVNGLRSATDVPFSQVREPLDFDAPWFYRVLGLLIGIAIVVVTRVSATIGVFNAKWIHLCVAAYIIPFGIFWIRSKPVTQSYGDSKRSFDVAFGVLAVVFGSALVVFALGMP